MDDTPKTVIRGSAAQASIAPPPCSVAAGDDLGSYHLLRRIGTGGFGEVFLAVHQVLRRQVALKVVHDDWLQNPDAAEIFLREARTVARFDHPNIVPVYDAGRSEQGVLYMAMRLMSGGDLAELIHREKPVPKQRALAIMRDCCAGLAAIHNLGLLHRDIKPANILLEADGRACISDLGLASLQREGPSAAEDNARLIGTPVYMAPERLAGKEKAGTRGDLYSLGMTFFELLNGEAPFAGLRSFEVLRRMAFGEMPKLELKRSDLGSGCEALLREMTEFDPARRARDIESVLLRVEFLLAEAEQRKPYARPLGRVTSAAAGETHARLKTNSLLKTVLESLPGPALVLNECRQVVAANGKAAAYLGAKDVAAVIGRRPGELLDCRDARRATDGCGTGEGCPYCKLGVALSDIQQGKATPLEDECLVSSEGGRSIEFAYRLSEMKLGDEGFVLVAMRDLGSEKRRQVLERSLVANLLDTADLVRSLADSTNEDAPPAEAGSGTGRTSRRERLSEASRALVEEAVFHQHLLAGEAGELQPLWAECPIGELLTDICEQSRRHADGEGRELVLHCPPDLSVLTDRILLRRSVRNLVKNALEACARGEQVTVEARPGEDGSVEIRVHNPQVMPAEARLQVFKRSFSTKAASGRGIGTHAARLFVQGFLHGQIGFTSAAPDGTTFWIKVPKRPPGEG